MEPPSKIPPIPRDSPPLAIGGIGGSGTRLFAQILHELGYHIGDILNKSYDNLLFTLLFRRKSILIETPEVVAHSIDILINRLRDNRAFDERDKQFLASLASRDRRGDSERILLELIGKTVHFPPSERRHLIAWKEPNTHIILDKLLEHESSIKYMHVVRDGLDMALSENQNQLMMWGEYFINRPVAKTMSDSLEYWNAVHGRVLSLRRKYPDRFQIVQFEDFCRNPGDGLVNLVKFVDATPTQDKIDAAAKLIVPPESIGRSRSGNTHIIDRSVLSNYEIIKEKLREACRQPPTN